MTVLNVNQKYNKRGFQSDLARRMGITRQAVNKILNGKRIPGGKMAKKLEDATGIDMRTWMFPDEYHNPLIRKTDGNGDGNS